MIMKKQIYNLDRKNYERFCDENKGRLKKLNKN